MIAHRDNAQQKAAAARIDRTRDIPKMGDKALDMEAAFHGLACNMAGTERATGGKGTGIIVIHQRGGRVFKLEITQVDGPL